MKVKQLLKSHVSGVQMGELPPVAPPDAELTRDLSHISRRSHVYFQVCFGALLLLFTGSAALVVRFMNDPGRLGLLFTGTGICVVGLVVQMVCLRKQQVTADVIALLARHLQPRELRSVIEILFAKL